MTNPRQPKEKSLFWWKILKNMETWFEMHTYGIVPQMRWHLIFHYQQNLAWSKVLERNENSAIKSGKQRQNKVIFIISLYFSVEMKYFAFFAHDIFEKKVQNCLNLSIWHLCLDYSIQKMLLICFWFELEHYCNVKSWRICCVFSEN